MRLAVKEATITKRFVEAARKHYGARLVIRKRHVAMGLMGDPDVYGSLSGVHFEIEMKRPGHEPTALQLERMKEWSRSGAAVGVAHSVEEAMTILEECE